MSYASPCCILSHPDTSIVQLRSQGRKESMESKTEPRYGFYDRLSASFPSQIIVDVTEICNLECIHCPHPAFKKSLHYGNRTLTADLNEKMANEVKAHGQ